MKFTEFFWEIKTSLKEINLDISEEQAKKLWKYMNLLLEWNEKINLTAITEPKEIILKHFVDSLTINKFIDAGNTVIDIGTGAGFPGIPIAIYRNDVRITLVDSLNKRINFLEEVKNKLSLRNVEVIHSRAEDLGKDINHREKYDVSVSRAVAPLNILLEYLVPFVKENGKILCMKGPNINEEINNSENALKELYSIISQIDKVLIGDMERNILLVRKNKITNNKYPRNAGIPSKKPL